MQQVFITGNKVSQRVVSGIDWSLPGRLRRIDPYLVWLDITSGEALEKNGPSKARVNLLLELDRGHGLRASPPLQSRIADGNGELIPTHNRYVFPVLHSFVSFNVPFKMLADFLAEVQRGDTRTIRRFELMGAHNAGGHRDSPNESSFTGMPFRTVTDLIQRVRSLNDSDVRVPPVGLTGGLLRDIDCANPLAKPGRVGGVRIPCQPVWEAAPLIGVVDDGCNLAAYLHSTQNVTLTHLWHQERGGVGFKRRQGCTMPDTSKRSGNSDVGKPIWDRPGVVTEAGQQVGQGSRFGLRLNIQKLKDAALSPMADPEVYRQIQYMYPTMTWTHGASMLDLVSREVRHGLGPRVADPRVEMVFVQLPEDTVEDTAGGLLSAHALDGIHDILDRAGGASRTSAQARPVVVNLSYGTHAGPHDGTSMFESALVELLCRNPNLHVALPAGNSHALRCHASGWLTGANLSRKLRWKILPDNPSDSFLEIWIHDPSTLPTIKVTSPVGSVMTATVGEAFVLSKGQAYKVAPFDRKIDDVPHSDGSPIEAALIFPPSVAQGDRGTMILVAIAPTRRRIGRRLSNLTDAYRVEMVGAHGVWEIEVRGAEGKATRFEAWIQRDDVAPGSRRARRGAVGRQTYFLDDVLPDETVCGAEPRCTMNGIATVSHERLWVVGAQRASDGGISPYSSSGPNAVDGSRFHGPDAVAYADQSINSPGITVAGVLGASRRRVSGTSVATARLSRMLADHLAQGKSADCFFWPHPKCDAPVDRVPAGAPRQAPALHRGEIARIQETPDMARKVAPQADLPADWKLPPDCFGQSK